MTRLQLVLLSAILLMAMAFAYLLKHPGEHRISQHKPVPQEPANDPLPEPLPKPEEKPPEPKPVEPKFDSWPKVRTVNNSSLGKILQDIDSHMPAGHQYSAGNKVTWAHETTHGINANIRNAHHEATKVNGFYCLNDRACVIYEPKTTIRAFAGNVPQGLRGPSYQLYLVSQTGGWNDRPLYLCDEWIAYTNGSETGRELNHQGWYYELLQAHNFNVYCMYMAMHVQKTCLDYDHTQLKAFMMWQIERTFRLAAPFDNNRKVLEAEPDVVGDPAHKLFHEHPFPVAITNDDNDPTQHALQYVEKVRTLQEAEPLRAWAREYFGKDWCKKVYGF